MLRCTTTEGKGRYHMRTTRDAHRSKEWLKCTMLLAAALLSAVFFVGCGSEASSGDAAPDAGNATPSTASTIEATVDGYVDVDFVTEDGLTLSGHVFGGPVSSLDIQSTRWVILCHMYPADQTSWTAEAQRLVESGYPVLTFDFRGYGASEGQKDIRLLDRDVKAAVQYVRESGGAQEVVLVGASMGGTASLAAAAQLQTLSSIRMAGVAALSAPVEFNGLSASQAATDLEIPLLLVAAEGDSAAGAARQLESLAGDVAELHILPGSEHGTDVFSGDQADAVRQLLIDFVRGCMPLGG
jgi:pimeloyl-ACP methyl ester carboxylesterase